MHSKAQEAVREGGIGIVPGVLGTSQSDGSILWKVPMSLMGCANEQAGRACDCDACTGTVWPAPPPVSEEKLKHVSQTAFLLGRACGKFQLEMIADILVGTYVKDGGAS
jgi:hypothetical protein